MGVDTAVVCNGHHSDQKDPPVDSMSKSLTMSTDMNDPQQVVASLFERKQKFFLKQAMLYMKGLKDLGDSHLEIGHHAEDVVSDSFMVFYKGLSLGSIPDDNHVQYMNGIIKNKSIDKYNEIRAKLGVSQDMIQSGKELGDVIRRKHENQGFFGKIYKRIEKIMSSNQSASDSKFILELMVKYRMDLESDGHVQYTEAYLSSIQSECLRMMTEMTVGLETKYRDVLLLKMITDGKYGDEHFPSSNLADARERLARKLSTALTDALVVDEDLNPKRYWLHLLDTLKEADLIPIPDPTSHEHICSKLDLVLNDLAHVPGEQELHKRSDLFRPSFQMMSGHKSLEPLINALMSIELEEPLPESKDLTGTHYELDLLNKMKSMIETHCTALFYNIKYLNQHGTQGN